MDNNKLTFFLVTLITLTLTTITTAATNPKPSPSPSSFLPPAPAPSPTYINLTHLLTVAGPFHTFLTYLQSTNVITTFQNQANNTNTGITIFVPPDSAFTSLKSSPSTSLSNLTSDQLRSLCLFHALPNYYSISDFRALSLLNPVPTFAGGDDYTLNFTDTAGTVHINSQWTQTKITSSVLSTHPVAVYEVDKVLLPVAIFGTDIPPAAQPVPAADSPKKSSSDDDDDDNSSLAPDSPSSAPVFAPTSFSVVVAVVAGVIIGLFL